MAFLTGVGNSVASGGTNSTSTNAYIGMINNDTFVSHGDIFKARVTHNLGTDNLYVTIHDEAEVSVVNYKYLNDNEIEIYYKTAKDVKVMAIGFGKINSGEKSIIGIGEIGKIILGKK